MYTKSELPHQNFNRKTTLFFCFLLGWLGGHRFYLRQWSAAIWSLFFAITFIPAVIAFFDFLLYLTMSEKRFDELYNQSPRWYCANCNKGLTFVRTPNLGGGWLQGRHRLCRACLIKLFNINPNRYGGYESKKISVERLHILLDTSVKPKWELTPEILNEIKSVGAQLIELDASLRGNVNLRYVVKNDLYTPMEVREFVHQEILHDCYKLLHAIVGEKLHNFHLSSLSLLFLYDCLQEGDAIGYLDMDINSLQSLVYTEAVHELTSETTALIETCHPLRYLDRAKGMGTKHKPLPFYSLLTLLQFEESMQYRKLLKDLQHVLRGSIPNKKEKEIKTKIQGMFD